MAVNFRSIPKELYLEAAQWLPLSDLSRYSVALQGQDQEAKSCEDYKLPNLIAQTRNSAYICEASQRAIERGRADLFPRFAGRIIVHLDADQFRGLFARAARFAPALAQILNDTPHPGADLILAAQTGRDVAELLENPLLQAKDLGVGLICACRNGRGDAILQIVYSSRFQDVSSEVKREAASFLPEDWAALVNPSRSE